MIISPSPLALDFLKSDLVRSPGIHASDIFGDLFRRLEPNRYDHGDAPPNGPLMALGTAWEAHLEKLLTLNGVDAHRPDECLSPEGIAFSPDLFIFNGVNRVGEIKLTSMSLDDVARETTNSLPTKFDKYMCQLMLYTHWLGWRHGCLLITSIRKPYAPEFLLLDIEFTVQDLQRNTAMVLNHWRYMQKEGLA
jgi:hypothetical protein